MLQKIFVVGVCFLTIVGCTNTVIRKQPELEVLKTPQKSELSEQERIKLTEERERATRGQVVLTNIEQLEQKKDLLSQKMLGQQQKISNLELHKNQLEIDLRAFNGKVESFMMDNVGAIACMGAVGATLDETNQYSKDAKDVAATATVVCGIAVLSNGKFREEVFFAVDQLAQADSHAKNIRSQINITQSEISTENQLLERDISEASRISSDIQKYQFQLEEP